MLDELISKLPRCRYTFWQGCTFPNVAPYLYLAGFIFLVKYHWFYLLGCISLIVFCWLLTTIFIGCISLVVEKVHPESISLWTRSDTQLPWSQIGGQKTSMILCNIWTDKPTKESLKSDLKSKSEYCWLYFTDCILLLLLLIFGSC